MMTSIDMLAQLEAVKFTTAQARLLIKIHENQQNLLATKKDVNFLSGQIENVEDKIENVKGQFKNMDMKIDNVETNLEAKIDSLEDKIDNVKGQFKNMDMKIDNVETNLEAKIDNLEDKIDNVETNLEAKIDNVRKEIKNMDIRIENLEGDVKEIKQKLSGMAKKEDLEKMEDSLKLLVGSSINKTKYDIAKWIVGAVVANGIIATLLSVFT